jgi:hypothetical protein
MEPACNGREHLLHEPRHQPEQQAAMEPPLTVRAQGLARVEQDLELTAMEPAVDWREHLVGERGILAIWFKPQ